MSDWWDDATSVIESRVFQDDTFFRAFPKSRAHYVDREISEEDIIFPSFDPAAWSGLQREEFEYESIEVMWSTDSAKGVRWVGSEENRMEVCYSNSSDWYFVCKQGELFFSVSNIGSHPEVHCNEFVFCNSDGSTGYSLNLSQFQDPQRTLEKMMSIAVNFIERQIH